jgi:hypothetical protein
MQNIGSKSGGTALMLLIIFRKHQEALHKASQLGIVTGVGNTKRVLPTPDKREHL